MLHRHVLYLPSASPVRPCTCKHSNPPPPQHITMTTTSRGDSYFQNLYGSGVDFRQLALQDADFRAT